MKTIVSMLAAAGMATAMTAPAYAAGAGTNCHPTYNPCGAAAGEGGARASSGPLLGAGLAGLLIPAAIVVIGVTAVAVAASNDDDNDDGAVVQTNNGIGIN